MTKQRISKVIVRTSLILLVIGVLIFHFIFPRIITERRNIILESFKTPKTINEPPITNDKFKRKKLTITTLDNLKLSAHLTYSSLDDSKGTVILLHGSSHTKAHFGDLSKVLSLNGFNSVALDNRGFGESEGQFFTFGVKETKDIQTLITQLINQEGLNNIGVWGQSIGGALALQTMGVDKRIKYGIVESAYTDLKTNIQGFFHRHTGFKIAPISNYLVDRAGSIGDFNPDKASPLESSKNITQPILVVHGKKDIPIKITEGKANFANIKSKQKEFIEIASAGHSDIWKIGGDDYFNLVLRFLNEQARSSN